MGKKRKFDATSSSDSSKKVKVADLHSRSSSVKYSDLPKIQQKTWFLNDNLNVLDEYLKLIDWIIDWGSKDGFEFDGIKTLGWTSGYPLIEVEVIRNEKSIKFLISRASLYVLAFYCGACGWRKFKDPEFGIEITENARSMRINARYDKKRSWAELGLKAMVIAFDEIHSTYDKKASEACLVFAVHLSEASRTRLVRSKIIGTMIPVISERVIESNDEDILLGTQGCSDILASLGPIAIDMNFFAVGNSQVEGFIKKFKQVSKAWITYALTRKKHCPLEREIADECGIKYLKTLRYSLLLLSNINLDKIIDEWVKKFKNNRCPQSIKAEDINFMESEVKRLLKRP